LILIVVVVLGGEHAAVLLGKVHALGGQELGGEVAAGFVVDVAALAGLSVLELGVRWEETLVVGWAAEGFFASGLGVSETSIKDAGFGTLTGSKVGLWAVVILAICLNSN
jgi:hypothetical protein